MTQRLPPPNRASTARPNGATTASPASPAGAPPPATSLPCPNCGHLVQLPPAALVPRWPPRRPPAPDPPPAADIPPDPPPDPADRVDPVEPVDPPSEPTDDPRPRRVSPRHALVGLAVIAAAAVSLFAGLQVSSDDVSWSRREFAEHRLSVELPADDDATIAATLPVTFSSSGATYSVAASPLGSDAATQIALAADRAARQLGGQPDQRPIRGSSGGIRLSARPNGTPVVVVVQPVGATLVVITATGSADDEVIDRIRQSARST